MKFLNKLSRAMSILPPVSLWMLPSRLDAVKTPRGDASAVPGRVIFLNGKRVRVR